MCTLTILRRAERLTVTMNRDDVASRPEAPPVIWPDVNPVFAAPKDSQAGGSWIAVNAHGIAACLLNRYDNAPAGRKSRGGVVIEAMRSSRVDEASQRLEDLALHEYSPFTCILISLDAAARLDWTGERLEYAVLAVDDHAMFTSSSWRLDHVKKRREGLFQALFSQPVTTDDRLAAFHCHHDIENERWTPMMRREYSETKSITQIALDARVAEMRYWTRASALSRGLKHPDETIGVAIR